MCGCGNKATTGARAATPSTSATSTARHGVTTVALRYRGARALLVRGPVTGVGYACYPGDTIAAHDRDAAALVASGAFAIDAEAPRT